MYPERQSSREWDALNALRQANGRKIDPGGSEVREEPCVSPNSLHRHWHARARCGRTRDRDHGFFVEKGLAGGACGPSSNLRHMNIRMNAGRKEVVLLKGTAGWGFRTLAVSFGRDYKTR
jgi:hypothetical protein